MPKETNLNVAPYFDDFTPDSNYYKVLYKPGFPVQARELTTMQSILQDQIESMGNHFFKEGAKVIPGGTTFEDQFIGIQIDPEFLGVPVSLYLEQLVGKEIKGASSGVTAEVVTYITDEESDRGTFTLYVTYRESGTSNEDTDAVESNEFFDNEVLQTVEDISFATTFIAAGEGFASTIASEAGVVGMAFQMSAGVYFLRGHFVDVDDEILILDQYSNTSSHRIGFQIIEEIISADIDPSLSDNAQGFNNFTAPGADRLKITASLIAFDLDEINDENFVEIATVIDGAISSETINTDYNFIGDELARRTYDESGHYYVREFTTTIRESLNDQIGNRGIYDEGTVTQDLSLDPTDDLMVYKVSPGKAYVKGYEVETLRSENIDVQKPRSTKTVENQSVNFAFGPSFQLNNVTGSPTLGFNNSNTISLRSERVGSEKRPSSTHITGPADGANRVIDAGHVGAAGSEIGVARLYDFALETGSYDAQRPQTNQWDISLWDLQMYTTFEVNTSVSLTVPTHIKGQSSGATAFLRYSSVGTGFTAYDVKGTFFKGERLSFDGVPDNDRFTVDVHNYEISDIASLYGSVGVATFTGDLIPKKIQEFGSATVGAASSNATYPSGFANITSAGDNFVGIVSTGDLIKYKRPGREFSTLNKVIGVTPTSLTVVGVNSVTGVVNGGVGFGQDVSNLQLVGSLIQNNLGSGNEADNESLYSVFPKENVQYVDLGNSSIVIRRQFDVTITGGETSAVTGEDKEVFLPFDEERYILIDTNGNTIAIDSSKLKLTNSSSTATFVGLSLASGSAKLIATLRKSNIVSKTKIKKISENVVISKSTNSASGIGGTTLNDGLSHGNFAFGARVQDDIISLNVPDVNEIYGIFESNNLDDPECPSITLGSLDGPNLNTSDLIIGERFVGETSGTVAIYLVRNSDNSVGFVYLNNSEFEPGEVVTFEDSDVSGTVTVSNFGSSNITQNFTFQTGQVAAFYGISNITRKADVPTPTHKLKIYFSRGTYDSNDTGDITTVNSYGNFNYGDEISEIDGNRLSDIIDARPVTGTYSVVEGARSPFEFFGRDFDDSANNGARHSSQNILASDESMTVKFNYYLPRADRLYLDSTGTLDLVYGTPADEPRLPPEVNGSMNIANIFLPAYLYDTDDADVKTVEYKRYQMSDIAKLEQRIKNVEYYTSLNQVESDILNKFVPDANGLNRFKSGIFVDNFTDLKPQDTSAGVRNSIDKEEGIMRPSHYTTALNMQIGSNAIAGIGEQLAEDTQFATIEGTGIKKTGSLITLDYEDEFYQEQPYATRAATVTSFAVTFYKGNVELEPDTDVWIDVTTMKPNDVMVEGSFEGIAQALGAEVTTTADGSRMGVSPVEWNSWETVGVKMKLGLSNKQQTFQKASRTGVRKFFRRRGRRMRCGIGVGRRQILTSTDVVVNKVKAKGGIRLDQQRTGSQKTVTEKIDTVSLGSRVVSRDIIHYMRSRDIQFTAKGMKPYNRVYAFFDGVDVTRFCVPKLVEIQMIRGTFRTGETIKGFMSRKVRRRKRGASPRLRCRLAAQRHKFGPHKTPTDQYVNNPYDKTPIPENYSGSSTLLNIDTASLASDDTPQFDGYIAQGMFIRGRSSRALARVKSVRLIPDQVGTLIGTFHVPDSASGANPIFETGTSTFRLTGSPDNDDTVGTFDTSAEEKFYSQGTVDATQESTLSMRNAKIETDDFTQTRDIGDEFEDTTDIVTNVTQNITNIDNRRFFDQRSYTTNVTKNITNVTNVTKKITNVTKVTNVTNVTNVTKVVPPKGGSRRRRRRRRRRPRRCVDPMMRILMANGSLKRAGDIKIGDMVKTYHEDGFGLGEYKVEYVDMAQGEEKIKLTFDKTELICSLSHKLLVDGSWKEAKDMVVGDKVSGKELVSIERVEDGDVVHLTIEGAHTYICEGLLSHNKRKQERNLLIAMRRGGRRRRNRRRPGCRTRNPRNKRRGGFCSARGRRSRRSRRSRRGARGRSRGRGRGRGGRGRGRGGRGGRGRGGGRGGRRGGRDPLAQTFNVEEESGIFLTKVDVFFQAKDNTMPVKFEISETNQGVPAEQVLAYSDVYKDSKDVFISDDASVPTTFTFKSPVYLDADKQYALILKSNSSNYRVWISRLGEADVGTLESETGRVVVSKQPVTGSLFRSQNASTWTPSQYEDLKYVLYKADFIDEGSVTLYNPRLPETLEDLPDNGVTFKPNKVRVGLGVTYVQSGTLPSAGGQTLEALKVGNTVFQANSNTVNFESVPNGTLVGFAGSIRSTRGNTVSGVGATSLPITNAGIGYTPLGTQTPGGSAAGFLFTNVASTNVTGLGQDARFDVTILNGVAVAATCINGGSGYTAGDVLTLELGQGAGEGIRITVGDDNIDSFNELILTDVQGDFDTSATAYSLRYVDNILGIGTAINYAGGAPIEVKPTSTTVADGDDGLHLKIRMKNHGMYNSINRVTLTDIESDLDPSELTQDYSATSTANLGVLVGTAFTMFEGLTVGAAQTGYIRIDDEVIGYTGVSGNTLTGISRGVDGTDQESHDNGDLVSKYEYGGVSLRRINKTHDLGDVTVATDPIGIDHYHVKIDPTSNGLNRSSAQWDPTDSDTKLPIKFKTEGFGGGPLARSTYNIPYSIMIPKFEIIQPSQTSMVLQARTVSGSTVNSNEASFVDQGFTDLQLHEPNYFDSVRQVSSQLNEDAYLTDLPGNKSLSVLIDMSTENADLSPMLNLDHAAIQFINNRINRPVTNYEDDLRVNTVREDPDRFFYITKNVVLENPATSLEVIIDGYVPDVCDLRVFYAVNQDKELDDVIFTPFPGYKNLNNDGKIITQTKSDGLSNLKVPKVDQYVQTPTLELFKEYIYSSDDISPFNQFRIKIVGTSTNAAVVPQLRNLRATALA